MTFLCACRRKDPVAAQASSSLSSFSGVGMDCGGIRRWDPDLTEADLDVDDWDLCLDNWPFDMLWRAAIRLEILDSQVEALRIRGRRRSGNGSVQPPEIATTGQV